MSFSILTVDAVFQFPLSTTFLLSREKIRQKVNFYCKVYALFQDQFPHVGLISVWGKLAVTAQMEEPRGSESLQAEYGGI